MRYRIEHDALGAKQIPAEAYYGIGSYRSKEAFNITKHGLLRQMIKAFASLKKAFAKTNLDLGYLDKKVANVISLSCDEILNGRLHGQFVTDIVQGGLGLAMDKNANEVIANRANEMLGGEKGNYEFVSLQAVALNQLPKDNVIIAGRISAIRLSKKLLMEAKKLSNALEDRKHNPSFSPIKKEWEAFNVILEKDMKRVDEALNHLKFIPVFVDLSKTEESNLAYAKKFVKNISQACGEDLELAKNMVENRRNLDGFAWLSSALKQMMMDLSKIAKDLELMHKQKQLKLPQIEVDDYFSALEVIKQISFYIMGNDLTVARAIEAGELDENRYQPIIYACLFESLNIIRRALRTLREQVVEGIEI
ncbi:MAG TPA: lyase family protein [Bacilli bacterium]|nr:MAG: Aspartate ammonia-lyase [Tenericutes bacterium ADurb.BinA124]HNZ50039.1 lyase family protein [Bacilli bacterium]HPX84173.1 lyase family protein [Bacilli bacterium]HQC74235.1 lyase family protein [Bacilli bacterium]